MITGDAGEECGVIAISAPDGNVAPLLADALLALQHRGQESAGLSVGDGMTMSTHVGMGLVREVLDETVVRRMSGRLGIGHVRYSTSGVSSLENAQPVQTATAFGAEFALAHNGNFTGLPVLTAAGTGGAQLETGQHHPSDSMRLAELLSYESGSLAEAMTAVLPRTRGAYSLVGMAGGTIIGLRDPHGFRPLCIGRLDNGGWAIASETAALDGLGATEVREIEPGEIVEIDGGGIRSTTLDTARNALCVFEHIYFARPDSVLSGRVVHDVRRAHGQALARLAPASADLVIPVPDTGRGAALGFADESGIRYGEGLFRNTYVSRSFIQPTQSGRERAVRLKLRPIPTVVAGRRLVVVDDSIVRATSIRQVVAMLRRAGAAEVHLRIASPPVRWPCFFGVDFGTTQELVAHRVEPEEIARLVGADTLAYLPVEALTAAAGGDGLCTACFTGDYP